MKKLDRSMTEGSAAQQIYDLLRRDQKPLGEAEDERFLIGRDDSRIIFAVADITRDKVHSFTMEWKLACFVGYCLITEAIKLVGRSAVGYLGVLAIRRQETEMFLEISQSIIDDIRSKNDDDYSGEGIA